MNPFCVDELVVCILGFLPVCPTYYHAAMCVSRKWNTLLQPRALRHLLLEFEFCQKIDPIAAENACAMGVFEGQNASNRFPFLHVLAKHIYGVANSCSLLVSAARHIDLFAGPSLVLPRCVGESTRRRIRDGFTVFDPDKLYLSYVSVQFWADLNSGKFESNRGYRHHSLLRVCRLLQSERCSVSEAVDTDIRGNYYPLTDGRFAWSELTDRQFLQIYTKVCWLPGSDGLVVDLAVQSYNRVRVANQNLLTRQQNQERQHWRPPKRGSNSTKKERTKVWWER
jgi:hypothetical protein